MYCRSCGAQMRKEQRFCNVCGFENAVHINNTQTIYECHTPTYEPKASDYPMKWFHYLIYFALFLDAVVDVSTGLQFVSGSAYYIETNGLVSAGQVYALYGTGLKVINILYGVIMLLMAVFGIVTRFKLANFKKGAPMMLYILNGADVLIFLIYLIVVSMIAGISVNLVDQISLVAGAFIGFVLNYRYFSKRKVLFCN